MKHKLELAIILGALAACMACGTAQASTVAQGDFFSLVFNEDGTGSINLRNGSGFQPDNGFAAVDPNTGVNALTYLLSGNIATGIVDVLDSSGGLSDALSFYNIGGNGYMAYYSTLPGHDLADTISAGFVPSSTQSVTEVGNKFAYFSGGAPGVNNDYFGTSSVPDGGSTLALLSGTFALVGAFSRKLRK